MAAAAAMSMISGSEQALVAPDGPYTTRLLGSRIMSDQLIAARPVLSSKRERLKAIVADLGAGATPAAIREEAYRVGFGAVNSWMLIAVRNELFPGRPKHAGGRPAGVPGTTVGSTRCESCGSYKTRVYSSHARRDGTTRRVHKCQPCGGTFETVRPSGERVLPKSASRAEAFEATERRCTCCKLTLPVSRFGLKPSTLDEDPACQKSLYRSHCKECSNQKRSDLQLRATLAQFGLSLADYQAVLATQGGRCAICRTDSPGVNNKGGKARRLFCVDHCHKTGRFRGLLCSRCNLGIGNFKDDAGLLSAAINYLRDGEALRGREEVTYG